MTVLLTQGGGRLISSQSRQGMTKVVGVAPTAPMRPMRSPKKGMRQARKQVEQTYLKGVREV